MFFHRRSRKGNSIINAKPPCPAAVAAVPEQGGFTLSEKNVEDRSGEALLDLGQVGQLVEDLGVVEHAAEPLRTHFLSFGNVFIVAHRRLRKNHAAAKLW